MKISVTQEDIAKGERRDSCNCPIALAVKRQPDVTRASIGIQSASVDFTDSYGYGFLPPKATLFVHEFDSGQPVQPFEFDLLLTMGEEDL